MIAERRVEQGTATRRVDDLIASGGEWTFNLLMRNAPVTDKSLEAALTSLIAEGRIEKHGDLFRRARELESMVDKPSGHECPTCQGRTIVANNAATALFNKYLEVCRDAPMYSYAFNQRPVTLDTSWQRALYLNSQTFLSSQSIVLLGDDDLTSIALAILNSSIRIQVLEADLRLVNYINSTVQRLGQTNLSAAEYDARSDVPDDYRASYDLAICDPSSTLFDLFLSRCIDLTARSGQAKILTFAYPTYQLMSLDLQERLTMMGLRIAAMIPNFNRYRLYDLDIGPKRPLVPKNSKHNETVAFVEALLLLDVTSGAQPAVLGKITSSEEAVYGDRAMSRRSNPMQDPSYAYKTRERDV